MNLLLLTPEEAAESPIVLTDDRARHVAKVLRAAIGDTMRTGILDGPCGTATVRAVTRSRVELEATFEATVQPRPEDALVLAVPRPIVLARCIAMAASLGFGRIHLIRTWAVDKNHLTSHVLQPEILHNHLLSGLSQAMRTHVPELRQFPLFKPFVEDELDAVVPEGTRVVAHPEASRDVAELSLRDAPFTLAIGPERGFTDHEVEKLAAHGFTSIRAGRHPLRVETALASITGQLGLLRKRSEKTADF